MGNTLKNIWDFILIWIIGIYYLIKQLVERHRTPTDIPLRVGQVAVITGGSSGIGLEVVRQLLSFKIHTIIASNLSNSKDVIKSLKDEFSNSKVEHFEVDMSSFKSVRNFAQNFLKRGLPLHVLINNAGVMFGPFKLTEDGVESQLGINYVGHFLLTYLLLPKLIETGKDTLKTRVINVTSCCHYAGNLFVNDIHTKKNYSSYGSYANSKLALVMHAMFLQELLNKEKANVTINAVHPGVTLTNLYQYTIFSKLPALRHLLFQSAEQSADCIVHVALSWDTENLSGKYFENCRVTPPNKLACNRELRLQLWKRTCELLNVNDLHDK